MGLFLGVTHVSSLYISSVRHRQPYTPGEGDGRCRKLSETVRVTLEVHERSMSGQRREYLSGG